MPQVCKINKFTIFCVIRWPPIEPNPALRCRMIHPSVHHLLLCCFAWIRRSKNDRLFAKRKHHSRSNHLPHGKWRITTVRTGDITRGNYNFTVLNRPYSKRSLQSRTEKRKNGHITPACMVVVRLVAVENNGWVAYFYVSFDVWNAPAQYTRRVRPSA